MALIERAPFTPRRLATLGFFVTLLIIVGWLHFTGAAGTRGMDRKDMDWNGDGNVSMQEMLQSFYAVTVKVTNEGARECRAYSWRGRSETLRVDCRTVIEPAGK